MEIVLFLSFHVSIIGIMRRASNIVYNSIVRDLIFLVGFSILDATFISIMLTKDRISLFQKSTNEAARVKDVIYRNIENGTSLGS